MGPQGPQGPQGQIGLTGPQGPQGAQGPQGIEGPIGPVGPVGPIGPQGVQGVQGIQGIAGDKYATTSTSSVAIGNGIKLFVVDPGLSYTIQQSVTIAYDNSNHMHGDITAYQKSNGVMYVDVKGHSGSGTYNSWTINLEGAVGIQGPQGIQGEQGPAGADGATGATGPQGPAGPVGDTGPQGPAGNAWSYWGEYDNSKTYVKDDLVQYNGSSYLLRDFIGAAGYDPVNYAYLWLLVAAKGSDGLNGMNGAQGPQGEVGPQGPEGPQGPAGPAGDPGGPPGPEGPQGPQGPEGPMGQTGSDGSIGPPGPSIEYWDNTKTYTLGAVVIFNGALYDMISNYSYNEEPGSNYSWRLLSISNDWVLAQNYMPKSGGSFTQKVAFTPISGQAGLNIGIGGLSTNAITPGDLWIQTGGTSLNYRDGQGTWRVLPNTGSINTFTQPQIISTTTTSTTPALRITNPATASGAHSLVVEDDVNPDATSFVINNAGNVGIGVSSSWSAVHKLEVNGNIKASSITFDGNSFFKMNGVQANVAGGSVGSLYPYEILMSYGGSTYAVPARFISTP